MYYYINLESSIIFCLCSGEIYLFLINSSSFVSELFSDEVFQTLLTLSATLFPIKSPVASDVFFFFLFEALLSVSVTDCSA